MTTDADLLDRVTELEQRAQRLVLAGNDQDGSGAWHNHLEIRLMQERDSPATCSRTLWPNSTTKSSMRAKP